MKGFEPDKTLTEAEPLHAPKHRISVLAVAKIGAFISLKGIVNTSEQVLPSVTVRV